MRRSTLSAAALILLASGIAFGDSKLPHELEGIDILDRRGADVPKELAFLDQDGKPVTLADYFDGKQPVLMVLAYYQCPMLCSIVLNGVVNGAKDVGLQPGKGFRLLTVSIDPRDTTALAGAKRENYVTSLGQALSGPRAWDFLLQRPGPEGQAALKRLAEVIGFQYRWDEKTEQFAHAAGAFIFTPAGKLSRTLTGIEFPSRDLRLSLVEASEGKLGGAWDKVLLFCYHYEPGEGYTVAIMRIMRVGGGLTVIALVAFLIHLWRRERTRKSGAEPKAA